MIYDLISPWSLEKYRKYEKVTKAFTLSILTPLKHVSYVSFIEFVERKSRNPIYLEGTFTLYYEYEKGIISILIGSMY